MFLLRTFQLGMKSLLLHPMRSLLTVLGIFIGILLIEIRRDVIHVSLRLRPCNARFEPAHAI